MAIEAWYMDDSSEDQRLPHKQQPNKPASGRVLDDLGVFYWKLDATNPTEDPEFKKIKEKRGYNYTDVITIAKDKLPNYEEKIKTFFEEHIHTDEEIRLCLEGSGYFDIRDFKDQWIRVHLKAGEMIVLPAGSYHRFTLDSDNYIKAMRLFQGDPVWTPLNRPDASDETEARKQYVQQFLYQKVKQQVEFYFSDSNFRRDKFMQAKAKDDEDGFIDISILLTFNKLKSLTEDEEVIAKAMKDSETVVVSEDGKRLRRKNPLPEDDDSKTRAVYADGFGESYTIEDVQGTFKKYGKILYVRLNRKLKLEKQLSGTAMIEFSKQEEAKKAVEAGGKGEILFKGKPLAKVMLLSEYAEQKKQREGEMKEKKSKGKKDADEEEEEPFKMEYDEGLIVKFAKAPPTSTREDVKESFSSLGQVAYVDFNKGLTEGYVRFQEKEAAAKSLEEKIAVNGEEVECTILTGDEEKSYWEKVWEVMKAVKERKNNANKGKGGRKRGAPQRGTRRSERHSNKKIKFNDDE